MAGHTVPGEVERPTASCVKAKLSTTSPALSTRILGPRGSEKPIFKDLQPELSKSWGLHKLPNPQPQEAAGSGDSRRAVRHSRHTH